MRDVLHGRDDELSTIDRLLAGARAGTGACMIVRGEPGIGKTVLMDHAAASAEGMRVLRCAGAEPETALPFAGLYTMLRPVLDRATVLPAVQLEALHGAFGMAPARPGDRFLVGLAVLSLLSALAEQEPLLCVVDDAHWLDRDSATALLFAARRLHVEPIVMLFATHEADEGVFSDGLPELRLPGLSPEAASALLDLQSAAMSSAMGQRVLAEARGNPLALAELPKAFAGPRATTATPLTDRLLRAFGDQVRRLPEGAQVVLLLAACEPDMELSVLRRAAYRLNLGAQELARAERSGLIRVTAGTIAFRHPLIRAATYQQATAEQHLEAHRTLAVTLDEPGQADRRAWHIAAASPGPDEDVAAALEEAAARARLRGGYALSGTFCERAARLSAVQGMKARRLGLAAEAFAEAGDFDRARTLAAEALPSPDDPELAARLLHVQASADFTRGALRDASVRWVTGAGLVSQRDPALAISLMSEAVHLAWFIDDGGVRPRSAAQLAVLDIPAGDANGSIMALLHWLVSIWNDEGSGPGSFSRRCAAGAICSRGHRPSHPRPGRRRHVGRRARRGAL